MFTAFFVVRTSCSKPDMHEDYGRKARTHARMHALTAMIPLYKEYADVPDFQLLYRDADQHTRQYRYKHGEAIVFGASFVHSTEPGSAHDADVPHVYLCFTFGTDKPEHWPAIASTIDGYQSRVLTRPDGSMVLSSWARRQQQEQAYTPPSAVLLQ